MDRAEINKYLKSKGFGSASIEYILNAISEREAIENARNSEEVKRGKDIIKFKPNPGKATLTQVGETQTFLGGDNHGLPIYKEDIDMIKRSGPLAKRLVEMNKTGEVNTYDKNTETLRTLRDTIDEVYPGDLNTGPDTTENIHEIGDNYPGAGDWKEWRDEHADVLGKREEDIKDSGDVMFGNNPPVDSIHEMVKKSLLKSQGIMEALKSKGMVKNNERGHDTSDVMWYFDPESQKVTDQEKREIKRAHEKDVDTEECNKNVSQDEEKKDPGDYYKYSTILKRMDDTHTRKNNDYGDAAYQGYKELGDAYYIVQLHNKLSRLKSLTVNNKTQMVKDESIDDTLLDMANYAVMFLESRHRND